MLLALYLGALNVGTMIGAVLRYPIPIAMGLYYGGEALRSGWGPIETFSTGFAVTAITHAILLAALTAENVAIRSAAVLVTGAASLWVGAQMVEAACLILR